MTRYYVTVDVDNQAALRHYADRFDDVGGSESARVYAALTRRGNLDDVGLHVVAVAPNENDLPVVAEGPTRGVAMYVTGMTRVPDNPSRHDRTTRAPATWDVNLSPVEDRATIRPVTIRVDAARMRAVVDADTIVATITATDGTTVTVL